MGGLSSLVWKYILTGFPGYLREGGCKLRHSPLYFPPLSPIIISITFTFLLTRSIAIAIVHHKLLIIKDTRLILLLLQIQFQFCAIILKYMSSFLHDLFSVHFCFVFLLGHIRLAEKVMLHVFDCMFCSICIAFHTSCIGSASLSECFWPVRR